MTEAQQNDAAQLVIMMVIVGLIVFGVVGSFVMKWIEDRAVDDLSTIPPAAPAEITSISADDARPMAARPRTDEAPDGRTPPQPTRDEQRTLYRLLRAHGITRDEARAALRPFGIAIGNDVWAASAPADDDADYTTPYAGRRTKAQYYPDSPELEYAEPSS